MGLCASSLIDHPKSTSSADPPKAHVLSWFLATKRRRSLCTIHAIPQAACRSGAMRLGPVGVDRGRRRYLRITILMTPSPIEVVATSFIERSVVSMRWTRGLQTEVLEHMPPCSAPRWLLIAFALDSRICAAYENLAGLAKWCSTVARRLQRKRRKRTALLQKHK